MNLNIKYWFFKSALPERLCDKIIKYGESKKEIFAVTGNIEKRTKENVNEVMKYRNSNVSWISEKWLYRYIHFYTHVANENAKLSTKTFGLSTRLYWLMNPPLLL